MIKRVIVVTPTSLQKNFIKQSIQYGLSQKQIDTNYIFYTIQGITNAIENKNINNPFIVKYSQYISISLYPSIIILFNKYENPITLDAVYNNVNIINVYNFFTCENPGNMVFRGHNGKITAINWMWDDSGFYSCS